MSPILVVICIFLYLIIAGIVAGVITHKNARKDREAVEENVVVGLFWAVYIIFLPILLIRNGLVKVAIFTAEKIEEFSSKKKRRIVPKRNGECTDDYLERGLYSDWIKKK